VRQYVELLKKILSDGEVREDRTGVGTKSIFGGEIDFDLLDCFPLVTVKKTLWRSAFVEMLWFLRGEANIKFLKEHSVNIWDAWADKDGNLGPVYGVQWRKWPGKLTTVVDRDIFEWAKDPEKHPLNTMLPFADPIGHDVLKDPKSGDWEDVTIYQERIDQIKNLIDVIKKNPNGRRHIVTAWNPGFIAEMGLPPCHRDFQCYVSNDTDENGKRYLELKMAIRSWDTCLGGPFNIAQYALLTHLIARATGTTARRLSISYGDAHIYLNHIEPISKHLGLYYPLHCETKLVFKTDNIDIDGYKIDDFDITGYFHQPFLSLPVAV